MNQNAKITLWKNFGQFFLFHQFWYAKKGQFSILAVFQNVWDLHKFGLQIWVQNAKITLWKNFGQFFRFHRFWSSGPGMQKKIISQYYLYLKIYGTYINLGCRFEFRTQKLPYERILCNFFDFIDFGYPSLSMRKRPVFNISMYFKMYGTYTNLGCRLEFRTQKLPYERILVNFFDFIDFGHQVRVCEKRPVSQ